MKKSALIAVLAVALVLAFAATALARPNGNIYIGWDTANGTNNAVPTPHAGYTTSTEKCNVCHSVHYAAPSNYSWTDVSNPWTSDTGETQMLLRSSVANACNYCHIQTSTGGVQLYGGLVSNYTVSSGFAHNGPSAACSGCHAVHGAGTFQGGNITKILRQRDDLPIQPEVLTAPNASRNASITGIFADTSTALASADKYLQQVAFCTQCHAEYTDASESTITGGPGYYYGGAYTGVDYKGHPLKAAESTFVANGDNTSVQVAWKDSTTCRSCHDAGNVDETGVTFNSFPHYTYGYFVFSFKGPELGSTTPSATAGDEWATDGNCLKCHVNTGGAEGVNETY